MPRLGWGVRPTLLVIDMAYYSVDDRYRLACAETGWPAAMAIKELLEVARGGGLPIIYTKWCGAIRKSQAERGRWKGTIQQEDSIEIDEEGYEIVREISPQKGDSVIIKSKPSAFFGTDLESILNYHKTDTVIVTGMVTSGCVRATVVDAFSYNYYVIVPEECVADRGELSHMVSLFDIHMKYGDVLPLREVQAHFDSLG